MRFTDTLILVFLVMGFPPTARAQDAGLDPTRMEEVARMAHTVPDDTRYYDEMREEMGAERYDAMKKAIEDREKARDEFIRNEPGITPYLFAVLDKVYATRQTSFVSIMVAISERNDLTAEDLEKITSEMEKILDTPREYLKHRYREVFLTGGVVILRKFPSARSEDLTIRVLTRSDELSWASGKLAAAETLALIGTEKSLPHLEQAQDWAESNPERDDIWQKHRIEPMQAHHRNLKRRLEGAGRGRSLETSADSSKTRRSGDTSTTADSSWRNPIYWILALSGSLGLIVAAVVHRRSRAI